jgi:hypothetical protein
MSVNNMAEPPSNRKFFQELPTEEQKVSQLTPL